MLFWISLILIVIGIIALISFSKRYNIYSFFTGAITLVIGIFIFVIVIIIICINYINIGAKVEQNKERYNALIYKAENKAYRDDFGLIDKEVIDEIQAWNEDVVYYQKMQKNFWVGICYPNVYDQFNTIDYTKFQPNENNSINSNYDNKH